jgi:hypothetical protein
MRFGSSKSYSSIHKIDNKSPATHEAMNRIPKYIEEMESYSKRLRRKGQGKAAILVESFVSAYRQALSSKRRVPNRIILQVLKTGNSTLLRRMIRIMKGPIQSTDEDWKRLRLQAEKLNRRRAKPKRRSQLE